MDLDGVFPVVVQPLVDGMTRIGDTFTKGAVVYGIVTAPTDPMLYLIVGGAVYLTGQVSKIGVEAYREFRKIRDGGAIGERDNCLKTVETLRADKTYLEGELAMSRRMLSEVNHQVSDLAETNGRLSERVKAITAERDRLRGSSDDA